MSNIAIDHTPAPKDSLIMNSWDWERFDAPDLVDDCYHNFVKSFGDLQGKYVLDAGCGTGWLSVILAKRGAYVSSFDISADLIEIARKRAIANGVSDRVSFQICPFEDIMYDDNSFDLVVGSAILHHISDVENIIKPLQKILKPNGRALFMECFGNSLWLERLRLLVPVPVDDSDKTQWKKQIKYADINKFKSVFESVIWREYGFFSRLDRIINNQAFIRQLNKFDELLFKHLPFLKRYARLIVLEAKNPHKI